MKSTFKLKKDSKILIILESPNKKFSISDILKKAGYTKAVVTASLGHIMTLADDKKSFKNSGVYPDKDFDLNLKTAEDKHKKVEELKQLVKAAEHVYLMSDPDREGALISWSLIKFLKLKEGSYSRVVTHEITPKAVVHAIENPIPLEEDLIEAAKARLTVDKLIGYTLSPIAKKYVGARSVGRCQSVGLKLVADREREIQNFKPETYYDLFLYFKKDNQEFKAKYAGTVDKAVGKISDFAQVQEICQACGNKDYIINNVEIKERYESPKPPFCTSTFQQEVASKIGLKVKDAMSVAQKLFEGISINGEHVGLITYHRTDSTVASPEFLPQLKDYVDSTYGPGFYTAPRAGKKSELDQDGHECLRVINPEMTPEKLASYLSNDLYLKVYKLIWQRTVAAVMPNAKYEDTIYTIINNGHVFKMNSLRLIDPGFKRIYNYTDESSLEEKVITTGFIKDEKLNDCRLSPETKTTTAPPRYKEATLIKALQASGTGRPSTFATIVETVLSSTRGYCTLEDKFMVPTERGMSLAGFLDRSFSDIINLNYTKDLEEQLDLIAQGKETRLTFLQEFFKNLTGAVEANKESNPEIIENEDTPNCPKCGKPMVIRRNKFGKLFYGCSDFPACTGLLNKK